jgi:hypothetical protein
MTTLAVAPPPTAPSLGVAHLRRRILIGLWVNLLHGHD